MRRVLGLAGCDLTSVIRLTNYLTVSFDDMEQTNKYWDVRREFFGTHRPASTGVKVAALIFPELLIEIDAIAYAPNAVINPSRSDSRCQEIKPERSACGVAARLTNHPVAEFQRT